MGYFKILNRSFFLFYGYLDPKILGGSGGIFYSYLFAFPAFTLFKKQAL